MKEKLKIGILLNDCFIPAWEFQIINEIKNSDFAIIEIVIRNNSICSSPGGENISFTHGLIKLLEKTDRLIFKNRFDYKLKRDISESLKDVPELDINPGNNLNRKTFSSDEIREIRNLNLDIIVKFGYHNLDGDILKIPKYGIWTYSIDSCNIINSINTGFWEVVRNFPVTNSVLGIQKEDTEEIEVIFSSWESTCPFSININRHRVFWRSTLFTPRIMNGLYKYGDDYLSTLKNRFRSVSANNDRLLQTPSFLATTFSLLNYFVIVAKRICNKLFYTDAFKWQLLFDITDGSNLYSTNFSSFKKLSSPKGIFWADPFVVAENNCYYIFVEEFIYERDKAHISVLKLDNKGNFLNSERIIERPYHMSYPFIFKIDESYYMIPETCKNKTIELYRCIDFPYKWEFDRNLMENLSAVDTTLFYHNNKWWLFTSLDQTENISGCSTELFLFFTDDIFSGNWESHPCNPIVSDARTARPAGNLFVQDGKICRPSQNCSGRYGKGFNLNHITKFTEHEYDETLLYEVEPVWDNKLKGTHTLNFDKDFTVIDVYSFRKRISIK